VRVPLVVDERPVFAVSPVPALLVLTPTSGELSVEIHANQLRGEAWYESLFASLMMWDAHLVLEHAARETLILPLHALPVGGRHPLGPLHSGPFKVPTGTYRVRFLAEIGPYRRGAGRRVSRTKCGRYPPRRRRETRSKARTFLFGTSPRGM
jgi:hypothetical protein